TGFSDPAQVRFGVGPVHRRRDREALGTPELRPQDLDAVGALGCDLARAVELRAVAHAFLRQPEAVAHAAQSTQGLVVYAEAGGESERIDARSARRVWALVGGPVPGPKERRRRDQGHAAGGRIEVGRGARLGKAGASAS